MIRCLEERLLNVENTVSIEHGHEVKCHVFQQVDVVLVLVKHSMKELVNNVKWHLQKLYLKYNNFGFMLGR